jgi:hypothetical protein
MPCHAMHPIQDLFLECFSYELQFDMHFYMHSYLRKSFYSCKKWVLQLYSPLPSHFIARSHLHVQDLIALGYLVPTLIPDHTQENPLLNKLSEVQNRMVNVFES